MNLAIQQKNRIDTVTELLYDHAEQLTEWEKEFLTSIRRQLYRTMTLHPGQIDKYREIRKKIKGF